MKLVRLFLVAVLLSSVFTLNAQNSRLDGQSYTVVMVDEQNAGEEIIDVLTFNNNELSSKTMSKDGYSNARVTETGDNFTVTLTNSNGQEATYNGTVTDNAIHGSIVTTRNGQTVTLQFRGMPSAEWQRLQNMKEEAK